MIRPVDPTLLVRGSPDDPRLGSRVVGEHEEADVAIVGCADDTGVRNSGGRAGAAEGPTELRRWLYKQTTGSSGELERIRIVDLGDVLPHATIEETHAAVEARVASIAGKVKAIVFLGGGHDLAYASHSGLLSAREGRLAIVNLDAHLDVRPLKDGKIITSGTPFRRVIERWRDRVASYAVIGAQPQHNARSHVNFIDAHGGHVVTLDAFRNAAGEFSLKDVVDTDADFLSCSLDLDVVAAAFAPGVSAPPADGFTPRELLSLIRPSALLDVVELSPPNDENGRTARLGALAIWHFLSRWAAVIRAQAKLEAQASDDAEETGDGE